MIPPAPDEAEVTIFGPGYGESVTVHLGGGEWLVADSCLDGSGHPAAVSYLRALGVNLSTAVKLVVSTHWHDDHIRGIAAALAEASTARFALSMALREPEVLTLFAGASESMVSIGSGVDEMCAVLAQINARRERGDSTSTYVFAVADRDLLFRAEREGAPPACVRALSPSDESIKRAVAVLAQQQPREGLPKRRLVAQTPNHAAVVLHVQIGTINLLLGSDLEEAGDPATGWSAVLGVSRQPAKSSVYKVAHHGSVTGDTPGIWCELLEARPLCLLTPFINGRVRLPTERDVERVKAHAASVYASRSPALKTGKAQLDRSVEKTLKEIGATVQVRPRSSGYVQARRRVNESEWRVEVFGDACQL